MWGLLRIEAIVYGYIPPLGNVLLTVQRRPRVWVALLLQNWKPTMAVTVKHWAVSLVLWNEWILLFDCEWLFVFRLGKRILGGVSRYDYVSFEVADWGNLVLKRARVLLLGGQSVRVLYARSGVKVWEVALRVESLVDICLVGLFLKMVAYFEAVS